MAGNLRGNGSVPSLPPPRPKSPPEYPDLYGKRRELAKIQMLEREIGFLQEELKSIDGLQPASRSCKEVADFVTGNVDPLIPTTKKVRRSCRFWKWLCGSSCFSMSWLCCCNCKCRPKLPRCCSCVNCSNCCSSPCANCSMPSCKCSSCKCSSCCKCQCFETCKCNLNCSSCIPKCGCPSCPTCSCISCTCCCYPKCPKLNICSCCYKSCCFPCYLCF